MTTPTFLQTLKTVPRKIRGIRDSVPQGFVLGRKSAGAGPVELLDMNAIIRALNATPSQSVVSPSVQKFLDGLSSSQGAVIYRGANGWVALAPGTAGQQLQTGGPGANPSWVTDPSVQGLLDSIGSVQGSILYRDATQWKTLAPGTVGQLLQSGGAAANPSWSSVGTLKPGLDKIVDRFPLNLFGETAPSGGGGVTELVIGGRPMFDPGIGALFSSGFGGFRAIYVGNAATINKIAFYATAAAAAAVIQPAVYADNAGAMGALLGSGSAVTGVTQGLNKFPLTAGVAVSASTVVWVGVLVTVAGVNIATGYTGHAFFSGTTLPNPPAGVTYQSSDTWGTMWAE